MSSQPDITFSDEFTVTLERNIGRPDSPVVSYSGEVYRVFDFHTHYAGDVTQFDPTIRGLFERLLEKHNERGLSLRQVGRDPGALLDYLDAAGIDKACVLAEEGPPTNYSVDSSFVLGFCAQASERLFAIGNINPRIERNLARRCEALVRAGVHGFKIYGSDHNQDPQAPELTPLYEICEEHRLPVMFHSGTLSRYPMTHPRFGEVAVWEPLIKKYQHIAFVAAHGGKGGQQQDYLRLVREYHNVYIEISDMPFHVLRSLCDEGLSSRFLFGTDMPQFPDARVLILKVLKLPLSAQAKRAILYDNAARLLALTRDY